jgi:hypothetical protein
MRDSGRRDRLSAEGWTAMSGPGLGIISVLVCLISLLFLAAAVDSSKPEHAKPGYWEPRR